MEPKQFLKDAENLIYKEVAKNTNLILGKSKTASLSTGLFLKLPIEVALEKSHAPIPKLNKELKSFMEYFSAYTKMGDITKVYFTFMYHDEKDLKAIHTHMVRHGVFLAFVYMHEVQHIIRKHITNSYNTMMTRIAGDVASPHQLINIAEDHAINYSIKDLFNMSSKSIITTAWKDIEELSMYDARYHKEQMSDIDILKDLLASNDLPTTQQLSDLLEKVMQGGKESIQPTEGTKSGKEGNESSEDGSGSEGSKNAAGKGKLDKCSTASDDIDNAMADLSEALQDIIRTNTKGTQQGAHFEKEFDAIKVETGWFKKIKASFKRQVYYKTHDYSTNWANLNNTFRRIYKAPKKNFIDNKINIILSVDHSGSMATEDLQRLLYLVESEATRISSIEVIVHDTRVVKSFTISDDYDITNSKDFTEALATRFTVGGTSHDCVFEYIQNMKLPEPDKVIYMSFSDNYSEIEQTVGNYTAMRALTKYWISPVNNPVNVAGTNITMV